MDALSNLQLEILSKGSLPGGYLLLSRFEVDAAILVGLGLLHHDGERYWVSPHGRRMLEQRYPQLLLSTTSMWADSLRV